MGKGDVISLTPKTALSPQTGDVSFSFSMKEIARNKLNGNKDNSGVSLTLKPVVGNDSITVQFNGNYSGYHIDAAKPGWTYYNTYNGHSIRIYTGVNGINATPYIAELDLNTLYDFDFKIERVAENWFIRYKRMADTDWISTQIPAQQVPDFTSGIVPTIGIGSGDGGNTRQNGSLSVELDNVVFGEKQQSNEIESIDLSLALTAPTSVKTSEKATYQLTATNNGNAPATGVKAHFVVPRKSIATVDIPKNCTLNGRIIECALSDLGANQSATQTFSMTALRKGALSVVGLVNSSADDANYDDNKKSAVVLVK